MLSKLDHLFLEYDGILITSPFNMRYFSKFSGGEGAVWISKNQKIVFTDSRYTEQAENEAKKFEVRETNNWIGEVSLIVKEEKINSVLFEDQSVSASVYLKMQNEFEKAQLFAGSDKLNKLRMAKTEDELKTIAKAEQICCKAFVRILDFIKPGMSEKTVATELEYYMKQEGGEGTAFDTVAVSGARCSLPHGVPSDKKIERGDFVTLDFGCMLGGYASDMTRTIVVGKASEEQKKVYNAVKDAQQAGLDFIRAGVLSKDADNAARSVIESCGFGKYFRHSLGHGVGLLVHELPNLSPKSEITLEENMVVSCEPGIYIPDFGGVRIEDLICVKNGGNLNFTDAEKGLIEL